MKHALLLVSTVVGLCGISACSVDTGFDGTQFQCKGGECPSGFSCVDSVCVAEGESGETIDAGVDATPPDAGLLACDDQFGNVASYMLCIEDATSCEFFVTTDVSTACRDICAQQGAECLNSFDASEGLECTREPEDGCDVTHQSQLCVCARSPME